MLLIFKTAYIPDKFLTFKLKLAILSIVILCITTFSSIAQNDTLKQFVSGSILFDLESHHDIEEHHSQQTNSWDLYSGLSWSLFLNHNWVIGAGFGIESNYQKSIDNGLFINTTVSQANTYSFELSLRNVKAFSEHWSYFTQLALGGGISNNKIIYNSDVLSSFTSHLYKSTISFGII